MNIQEEKDINLNIRFAIMINKASLQSWQVRCLENILSLKNTILTLVIINKNQKPLTLIEKIKSIGINHIFFLLYKIFICKPASERQENILHFIKNIPLIYCKVTKRDNFSQYFSKDDIESIRGYNLDFILRFGFNIVRGEILDVSRYGIWSFHHDDEKKYRGCPPGFWEIYYNDSVTGAILQRLTNKLDSGIILRKSFLKTINYSYANNLNRLHFESSKWPVQVCKDINFGNTAYLSNNSSSSTKAPIFYNPTNRQMLIFFAKLLRNLFVKLYKDLFYHDCWGIGIIYSPIYNFLNPEFKPEIKWLSIPNKEKFLADPFGIKKNDRINIFCENFDYRAQKGSIVSMELNHNTTVNPKIIFDPNIYLSYPYLFEYRNEIYCIPEASHQREVVLYKSKNFPYEWLKISTILKDMAVADATVFQYENHWWLFCTIKEFGPNSNLFIWYAADLFGPWKEHTNNPVKTDIRSARPAGTPFIHNNYLYRPAQDCSKTYGGRIVINRIIKLTPTEFKEEQKAIIKPNKNGLFSKGMHTISSVGNITLIDGKYYIFSKSAFKNYLSQRMAISIKSLYNFLHIESLVQKIK